MQKLKSILAAVLVAVSFTGCVSTDDPNREVKIEQTKAVILPLASSAVRRVLVKNPEQAVFVRRAGDVFAYIRDTGKFDPLTLSALLEGAVADSVDADDEDAQLLIDVKNVLVALYTINYADRLNADVSENEFLLTIADVFATSIAQALTDANL